MRYVHLFVIGESEIPDGFVRRSVGQSVGKVFRELFPLCIWANRGVEGGEWESGLYERGAGLI
jgi:hypothetical protein